MVNDANAPQPMKAWSIYPKRDDVKMLNGPRFDPDANRVFKMDAAKFETIKGDPKQLGKVVSRCINRH